MFGAWHNLNIRENGNLMTVDIKVHVSTEYCSVPIQLNEKFWIDFSGIYISAATEIEENSANYEQCIELRLNAPQAINLPMIFK